MQDSGLEKPKPRPEGIYSTFPGISLELCVGSRPFLMGVVIWIN